MSRRIRIGLAVVGVVMYTALVFFIGAVLNNPLADLPTIPDGAVVPCDQLTQ